MTDPTLSAVSNKLDALSGEVRQIKVWLIGNGAPGVFGDMRGLRRDLDAHAAAATAAATSAAIAVADQRLRTGWKQRLAFDVARNVMTVLLLSIGGWVVATFVIGLRLTVGH